MRLLFALILALTACGVAAQPLDPAFDGGATADSGQDGITADAAIDDAATSDTGPLDGGSPVPVCTPRNEATEIDARDGFIEVCADPATQARAVCGDGSPYRFSYRPASGPSAGLLVYFRGGGACSDYVSCWGLDGQGGEGRRVATMENEVASPGVRLGMGRTIGFFDREDPTALFADFDVVYAPYCTGDGGLGSREVLLQRPANADPSAPAEILTYFHGADVRRVVIDFAAATFAAPAKMVIAGSSAGAYASMGAVPELIAAFGSVADVAYYGDGGMGVGLPMNDQLVRDVVGAHDGVSGRPLVRFVQLSFESDAVQISFAPPRFQADPAAFRAEARRLAFARATDFPENYRHFFLPGACHTLSVQPALYQAFERTSGGVYRPVVPAVRPNPVLVQDGVSLIDYLRLVTRGSGPLGADVPNVAPAEGEVSTECSLPGG